MDTRNDLKTRIEVLKKDREAVILAHNYQIPEVQDLADFCGDSLELARKAKESDAEVIVFCGVHFMAETAAILSPDKTVLLPDEDAGCPMADMATAADLARMKEEHPGAAVVCYVNSTAEVKARSDVCCTSSNAVEVVSRFDESREVIFVPDRYLGAHVERETGRKLTLWPGYCPTHARLSSEHVADARNRYPGAPVIVHPESRTDVCLAADEVLSTGGMVKFAREAGAKRIVVGTETGLLHRLKKENPGVEFIPLSDGAVCPNMKLITPEKIMWALEDMEPRISVDPEIARKALVAVERMLQSSASGAS